MPKLLYIDSTVREGSRTAELAGCLIANILKNGESSLEYLHLSDSLIPALDGEALEKRTEDCRSGDFGAAYFDFAKQFASADEIIIAAPFWDNSFPAVLKKYIESVCVTGITFRYSEQGMPIGLCRAKKLWYVCTAGGTIFDDSFGYGYIRSLAQNMFGIESTECIKAENLDIDGADVNAIMEEAKRSIALMF